LGDSCFGKTPCGSPLRIPPKERPLIENLFALFLALLAVLV